MQLKNASPEDKTPDALRAVLSKDQLTEKLACAHDHLARMNEKLKRRMKSYYDRDRKDVEFEVGYQVLAYYPPLSSSKTFYS